jgi:hypothetical protein
MKHVKLHELTDLGGMLGLGFATFLILNIDLVDREKRGSPSVLYFVPGIFLCFNINDLILEFLYELDNVLVVRFNDFHAVLVSVQQSNLGFEVLNLFPCLYSPLILLVERADKLQLVILLLVHQPKFLWQVCGLRRR